MIKACILNRNNNVSRCDIFKKFFECVNSTISLTCCTETDAVRGVAMGGILGYIPPKSVYLKFFYVVVLSP